MEPSTALDAANKELIRVNLRCATVPKLKTLLRALKLPLYGNKSQLLDKLMDALTSENLPTFIAFIQSLNNRLTGITGYRSTHFLNAVVAPVPAFTANSSTASSATSSPVRYIAPATTRNSPGSASKVTNVTAVPSPQLDSLYDHLSYEKSPYYTALHKITPYKLMDCRKNECSFKLNFTLTSEVLSIFKSAKKFKVLFFCAPIAKEGNVMSFGYPPSSVLYVNGTMVQLTKFIGTQKLYLAQAADITPYVARHELSQNLVVRFNIQLQSYIGCIQLVEMNTIESIVDNFKWKTKTNEEVLVALVKEHSEVNDDLCIQSNILSLRDPVSQTRISVPARATTCRHSQCFDLSTFFVMNQEKQTWKCAVCNNRITWDQVFIDGFFKDILEGMKDDDVDVGVEVFPDGKWRKAIPAERKRKSDINTKEEVDQINCSEDEEMEEAASAEKEHRTEVIDLTLSDDDEPVSNTAARNNITTSSLALPGRSIDNTSTTSSRLNSTGPTTTSSVSSTIPITLNQASTALSAPQNNRSTDSFLLSAPSTNRPSPNSFFNQPSTTVSSQTSTSALNRTIPSTLNQTSTALSEPLNNRSTPLNNRSTDSSLSSASSTNRSFPNSSFNQPSTTVSPHTSASAAVFQPLSAKRSIPNPPPPLNKRTKANPLLTTSTTSPTANPTFGFSTKSVSYPAFSPPSSSSSSSTVFSSLKFTNVGASPPVLNTLSFGSSSIPTSTLLQPPKYTFGNSVPRESGQPMRGSFTYGSTLNNPATTSVFSSVNNIPAPPTRRNLEVATTSGFKFGSGAENITNPTSTTALDHNAPIAGNTTNVSAYVSGFPRTAPTPLPSTPTFALSFYSWSSANNIPTAYTPSFGGNSPPPNSSSESSSAFYFGTTRNIPPANSDIRNPSPRYIPSSFELPQSGSHSNDGDTMKQIEEEGTK